MRNLNRAYAAGGKREAPLPRRGQEADAHRSRHVPFHPHKGRQGEPALPGEKWRSPHLPGTVRQAQNKKTSESRGNLS